MLSPMVGYAWPERNELNSLPSPARLERSQQLDVTEQYVQGVWSVYDTDGNGTLELAEFARLWEVLVKRVTKKQVVSPASGRNQTAEDLDYL